MELRLSATRRNPPEASARTGKTCNIRNPRRTASWGINVGEIIPVIIFGGGAVVLGLSYVAVYLMGKNAARKELGRHVLGVGEQSDRLDRVKAESRSRSAWSDSGRGSGTC